MKVKKSFTQFMKKGMRISQDTHCQVCTSCSINTPELLGKETGCLGRSMNRDKSMGKANDNLRGLGDGSVSANIRTSARSPAPTQESKLRSTCLSTQCWGGRDRRPHEALWVLRGVKRLW